MPADKKLLPRICRNPILCGKRFISFNSFNGIAVRGPVAPKGKSFFEDKLLLLALGFYAHNS
jgi:hypothetical protein